MALGGLLTLTNVGTSYNATNALKALGLVMRGLPLWGLCNRRPRRGVLRTSG